jgi:hypothetical protein
MRKLSRSLFVGSLLMACVGLAWAGGDDARGIVQKSIDAIGGEAKLAKYNAQTFTEKGTYYGMGNGLAYTGEYAVQWPGQFRMEILGTFTIVLNGDKGWVKTGNEVKDMTAEQLATQIHDHKAGWISSLVPLKDKAFALKMLPDVKVGDRSTSVVVASRKDYPEVTLYFDKANHLLVKMAYKTKAAEENFKEVLADSVFSEFKEIEGVKIPHKMVMHRDGKVFIESELIAMKANGKLDASTFAKPK